MKLVDCFWWIELVAICAVLLVLDKPNTLCVENLSLWNLQIVNARQFVHLWLSLYILFFALCYFCTNFKENTQPLACRHYRICVILSSLTLYLICRITSVLCIEDIMFTHIIALLPARFAEHFSLCEKNKGLLK